MHTHHVTYEVHMCMCYYYPSMDWSIFVTCIFVTCDCIAHYKNVFCTYFILTTAYSRKRQSMVFLHFGLINLQSLFCYVEYFISIECTLCFIIHVPDSKKSNKSTCMDQFSMLRRHIKGVANTKKLSEGNGPTLRDSAIIDK